MLDKKNFKIVFMGTPEFAVASLQALVENNFNVVGVITSTDKYGGRGGKTLIESAVKKYAIGQNIRVLQPSNLKNEIFIEELRALKADIQVVVAFRMLPVIVWDMPKYGTINLHGSLLPKYRGAAPINWAIIRGEKFTGVSTFKLKHEIDTGDIILQRKMEIGDMDSAGDVHDKMMIIGAQVVLETLDMILKKEINFQKQLQLYATDAPKLDRETCEIKFNDTVSNVYNFIRGLSPYPAAWFALEDNEIKVFSATKELSVSALKPGTILSDQKNYLKIACLDGYIRLEEVKPAGKKKMDIKSFLNGYKFKNL